MSTFCAKKIASPLCLGDKFKKAREEHGFTVQDFTSKTGLSVKHINCLEKNYFSELPKAKVFRLAYLRAYTNTFNLDKEAILKQFAEEGGWNDLTKNQKVSRFSFSSLSTLSIVARNFLIAGFVILFASYLIWQVKGVMTPPKLLVYTPIEGMVTSQLNIAVQGTTEKETHLTINGQEVRPNEKGQFDSPVDLSNGINEITISATKKHGKTTTITRHIIGKINPEKIEKVSLK